MLGSIFKGLGKEAGGAAVGAFKGSLGIIKGLPGHAGRAIKFGFSEQGRYIAKPLLRGGAEYLAYSGAAGMLDDYAQGNFEHDGSKNVASAVSFLLKAKGIHSAGMGIVGAAGRGSYVAASKIAESGVPTKASSKAIDSLMWLGGKLHPGEKAGGNVLKPGSLYGFLGGLSPERLLFKGAKIGLQGVGHVAAFPFTAAKGTYEYGKLFATARRAGKAARAAGGGFRAVEQAKWNTYLQGITAMDHPIAPAIAVGLGFGAASAYMNKFSPKVPSTGMDSWAGLQSNLAPYMTNPAEWEENRFSQPSLGGSWFNPRGGSEGSVDPANFGSGISIGRSAIKSQTVMDGQLAVANKMVTRRRV